MQSNLLYSKWSQIAGLLLIGGSVAWAIKLAVIISTDGRIINTGAAAVLMTLGIVLLLIGSTGIGYRLSLGRSLWLRVSAMLFSPLALFATFLPFGLILNPMLQHSNIWYAQQEAPIAVGVVVSFVIGCMLYRNSKSILRQV